MIQPADAKLIADSVLGQDLTQEECDLLSEIVKHKTFKKGDIIFDAGDKDATLYILVSGKIELTKDMGMNKHLTIATLKPGSLLGEMAFIDAEPHSLKAQAILDSEVLMISRDDFESFIQSQPLLTYHIMRAIIRYMHKIERAQSAELLDMHRMVQNEYTAQY